MTNGTSMRPPARVTWRQLRRVNVHRTSRPTDEALRKAVGEIASERGSAPSVDAVILASVQLATGRGDDALKTLMDKVREIEVATYAAPVAAAESGDPGE